MTENENENQSQPPVTPPVAPVVTPPPAAPSPPPQLHNRDTAPGWATELSGKIDAIPEAIVSGMREAFQPPAAPAPARQPQPKKAPATVEPPPVSEQTPGDKSYKSFGHRWFGIKQ